MLSTLTDQAQALNGKLALVCDDGKSMDVKAEGDHVAISLVTRNDGFEGVCCTLVLRVTAEQFTEKMLELIAKHG